MAAEHNAGRPRGAPEAAARRPAAGGVISCRRMLRRLGIEPGEGWVFAWGTAMLFLLGWAEVSVKNVGEVLFLKRVAPELIPLAFLLSAVLLVATTYAVARFVPQRDHSSLLPLAFAVLGLALLPLWWLVRRDDTVGLWLLVTASKQIASVGLIVFLMTLGDLVHAGQAKRLYAPLMAGVTLGTALGSFASDPLADWLGREQLLIFTTGVLGAAALLALPVRARTTPRLEGHRRPLPRSSDASADRLGIQELWRRSVLFRLLAFTSLASGLVGPMLYYQFLYVADVATPGSEGESQLLAFLAWFRGWMAVGILAIQLGLATGLYRTIGLPLAAAISPLVYLLGFVGTSIQLSLVAGSAAKAGTQLVDNAVYDPALRILQNLFPESLRSRAVALVEGPLKRLGGALGNLVTLVAVNLGNTGWVGFVALPITAAWLAVAALLWRLYPSLLIQASSSRGTRGFDPVPVSELLDATTERAMRRYLASADLGICRVALDVCCEGRPKSVVAQLARAAHEAPAANRTLILERLDRLLEAWVGRPLTSRPAARSLAALLEGNPGIVVGLDRANVVQAYGRLTDGLHQGEVDCPVLEAATRDDEPAVRLAATAALARCRGEGGGDALDDAIAAALQGDDELSRHIAREELRAALIQNDDGPVRFEKRLVLLAGLLERPDACVAAAEALADVAARHGPAAAVVSDRVLAQRETKHAPVRASALRFAGHAGLLEQAQWLTDHLADTDRAVAGAAAEGLLALGPAATDVLLVELSYGRRSHREPILHLLRDLQVGRFTLRQLYARELDGMRNALVRLAALDPETASRLVRQRLDERTREGLVTLLLLLAAEEGRDELADAAERLRRTADPRQMAILVEALDSLLPPDVRRELRPFLDERSLRERGREAARALGVPLPTAAAAARSLLDDPDELTRLLARATAALPGGGVAAGEGLRDPSTVLEPVEIAAYLQKLPLFERLSTRHLLDIGKLVQEHRQPGSTYLFEEGEPGTSMYLIVDGRVRITKRGRLAAELGPGEFFGELALLDDDVTRTASAMCTTAVHLLRLERDDLVSLMEELPAIPIAIAQELSRRFRDVMDLWSEPD